MKNKELDNILKKVASGNASEKEKEYLSNWLDRSNDREYKYVLDRYQILVKEYGKDVELDEKLKLRIVDQISEENVETKSNSRLFWLRVREVAATIAILILAVWGSWKVLDHWVMNEVEENISLNQSSKYGDDVSPGTNKAVMKLSDGATIVLDDLPDGSVKHKGGVKFAKTGKGEILLDMEGSNSSGKVTYNTISTPKGGEYRVTLPDGSVVWLNSASSITCPTRFEGRKREVVITGEVYFDIQKQEISGSNIPFIVKTKNQKVEVLGTQFNIKAYADKEQIATTLVEGSVKISSGDKAELLSPGQQSKVSYSGELAIESNVDIEKILAWKNGYFYFSDDSIDDVMNEVSRWYDVEVNYVGSKPEVGFGGQVSRKKNLSEVLRILELTGAVNFEIEGKQIKVYKK